MQKAIHLVFFADLFHWKGSSPPSSGHFIDQIKTSKKIQEKSSMILTNSTPISMQKVSMPNKLFKLLHSSMIETFFRTKNPSSFKGTHWRQSFSTVFSWGGLSIFPTRGGFLGLKLFRRKNSENSEGFWKFWKTLKEF